MHERPQRRAAVTKLLGLCLGLSLLGATPVAEARGEICRTCSIVDPCTGAVVSASGCCTFPEYPLCGIAFEAPNCVDSVVVGCLPLNF